MTTSPPKQNGSRYMSDASTNERELIRWRAQVSEPVSGAPSSSVPSPLFSSRSNIIIEEFRPKFARDVMFPVLGELFVRSFTSAYKQMKMSLDSDLHEWLEEQFDEEQAAILAGEHRCFTLCDRQYTRFHQSILAFVTLREDDSNSVYLAYLAVRQDMKRQGYGWQLVQHLHRTFPTNTRFWTIIRKRNQAAAQFYDKYGATAIAEEELRDKYGYDPEEYLGFEWRHISNLNSHPARSPPTEDAAVSTRDEGEENAPAPASRPKVEENQSKANRAKLPSCCHMS